LLNASVGVQRVLGRLQRPPSQRTSSPTDLQPRSHAAVRRVRSGIRSVVVGSRLVPGRHAVVAENIQRTEAVSRRSILGRLGPDRAVAVAVAGILLGASVISVSAGSLTARTGSPAANTGGTTGAGDAAGIAVGGVDTTSADSGRIGNVEFGAPKPAEAASTDQFAAIDFGDNPSPASQPTNIEGPFIEDGTLVKPIAVDTTVADGSGLVKSYTVTATDSLNGIATKFGVSMMTVMWANNLKSKSDIHKGQVLRIPPVTGLIVKVTATDTLAAIAARYNVDSTDILATNGIEDPNLVVGQILVIPGAQGAAIPVARPATKPSIRTSSGGGNYSPPASYSGGKFLWPVVGGGNYISQYFHYGHYAIDIAADYGSTVRAAAAGTVTFAGWKNNGGGYQVWVAHGSGLYTTYNHMSSITVGAGQHVGQGQQVGRVGQSGNATGPHCHFEVWRGPIWDGGTRVNPLGYF
jgi:murein DD-endopeptidase MepM/ murein hydrolase activator NlpD